MEIHYGAANACRFTAFDMAIRSVRPLRKESDKRECVSILVEDSLPALLDYGIEKGCFNRRTACVFADFITVFPSGDDPGYWEEDISLRDRLETAMGIDGETFSRYSY